MSERERQQNTSDLTPSCVYEKKQLLVKELPKAEGNGDFAASYENLAGKQDEMSMAFRKISAHGKCVYT